MLISVEENSVNQCRINKMRNSVPYIMVRLDEASIAEARSILRAIPKGWHKAAHYALKRTANTAKVTLARIMSRRMKGKVGDTKNLIFIHYPSFANLRSTVEVSEMGKQMIELSPQQDGKGVSYQPTGGGRRQHIPHAFIATGASRGRQVWLRARYRVGHVKMIEWAGRRMEAIYLMKEPGIWRFLKKEDINQIQNEGESNLVKNLQHGVSEQLRRWSNR